MQKPSVGIPHHVFVSQMEKRNVTGVEQLPRAERRQNLICQHAQRPLATKSSLHSLKSMVEHTKKTARQSWHDSMGKNIWHCNIYCYPPALHCPCFSMSTCLYSPEWLVTFLGKAAGRWKLQNASLQPLLLVVYPEATQQPPFDMSRRLEMGCWDRGKSCLAVIAATGRISEDNHAGWCRAVMQPARPPAHTILPPWRHLELPTRRRSSPPRLTPTDECMMFKQKRASDALNAFHKITCHQRATSRGQSLWDRCPGVLWEHLPCSLPGLCNGDC